MIDKLSLKGNSLGDEGVIYLLDKIVQPTSRVCSLDIQKIYMGMEGAMAVQRAVGVKSALKMLRVTSFRVNVKVKEILENAKSHSRGVYLDTSG